MIPYCIIPSVLFFEKEKFWTINKPLVTRDLGKWEWNEQVMHRIINIEQNTRKI